MKHALLSGLLIAAFAGAAGAGEIYDLYFKSHSGTHPISTKSRNDADIWRVDSGIKEVGIERQGCLGGCPVYTLIVTSDGSFRYFGDAHVERKSKFTGKIRVWRWAALVQYLQDIDYFSLDDRYETPATDQDSVFTTVVKDSDRKTIRNYGSAGPVRLFALQIMIDSLLTDAEWDSPK